MKRKSLILETALALACVSAGGSAAALGITATFTADNHYALYHGQADGSGLAYVGRNELGTEGNPGPYNFSLPETWNVELAAGDHVYVVAWDDGGAKMLLGGISWSGGQIVTRLDGWEYFLPPDVAGFDRNGTPPLSLADLGAGIAGASWSAPQAEAPNANHPSWGTLPGVPADARFLWHDDFNVSSSDGKYVVFRSVLAPAPIPEPGSWLLMAVGLGLLAGLRRPGRRS